MFINKKAELKILNKNSQSLEFPSYNHIVIDGEKYPITKLPKVPKSSSKDVYRTYSVIVSGQLLTKKGYMPNPMVEQLVFQIDSITFTK